ncbi:MAG TPA: glycosyltransferase family 4 protein, partial [Opitutus sp.]|nr:glycosyltransferase family 4 protein [Opitutus sp.]
LTDPPLVGVLVGLAAAVRGARCAHWVQDIYPEIATQLTGQRWLLALRPLRDAAWRRAQFCVVPGSDMARALIHARLPVERIITAPNWAPVGLSPQPEATAPALRAAWGLTDKFVVGYSGNLGRAHDLLPLLDLAEIMREDDRFAFLFIGAGPQRTVLETSARSRGLDAVQFRPPQPRDQLAASLAVADVHCVTLRAGAEQWVFPSKLYGIAAIGRPVAFIGSGHSEIARLIRSHGLGEAFERSEMDRFAAWLRQLRNQPTLLKECGTAALAFSTGGFDRALASWRRALADLPPDTRTGTKANR